MFLSSSTSAECLVRHQWTTWLLRHKGVRSLATAVNGSGKPLVERARQLEMVEGVTPNILAMSDAATMSLTSTTGVCLGDILFFLSTEPGRDILFPTTLT